MYFTVLIVYFAHHLIALTPLLDTLSPSSLPLSLFLSLSMTPSPQLRSNLALATTLLALFAVNAEAAANMCKNPADLLGPNDMCTTFYNIEIAKHLSPSSWDSVTCAELCGNAAAVQHMHGYPTCCGGEYCNGTPCPGNAKLLCHNSNGTCDPSATKVHAGTSPGPSPAAGTGMGTGSGAICKENIANSTADVSADLLGRASCATRTAPSQCTELNAGSKKDSFYEHTTFGTICCGARANVRCLDSSSMCKDGFYKPFYAAPEWEGKPCAFFDGFFLSRFDGTRVNWGDITCEEIAAAKYTGNEMIPLGVDTMSNALNLFAACCGGQANLKCSFGNIRPAHRTLH